MKVRLTWLVTYITITFVNMEMYIKPKLTYFDFQDKITYYNTRQLAKNCEVLRYAYLLTCKYL